MKRTAIPDPPPSAAQMRELLMAMKENIELLTGVRGDKLTTVPTNASLAEVIVALNKVIDRLS